MTGNSIEPTRMSNFEVEFERISRTVEPAAYLRWLITLSRFSAATVAFARLGLADAMGSRSTKAAVLARKLRLDEDALRSLLSALAGIGVLRESVTGRFSLTPAGHLLRGDIPGSLRSAASMQAHPVLWGAWGLLDEAVRAGTSRLPALSDGKPFFRLLDTDRQLASWFHDAMASQTAGIAQAIADAYDFSRSRTVVDVGGGNGALMSAICRRYSSVEHATVFDQPTVVASADKQAMRIPGATSLRFVGGDFFKAVPKMADRYILKFILHDWPDRGCVRILKTIRKAMAPQSRLLIIENDIGGRNRLTLGRWFALTMLTWLPGGKERSVREYRQLLDQSGLRLARVIRTQSSLMIFEARVREGM